ncbi:MAG: histidinol-phosphate transaminase [bacterium]|nr:histidinol-phosphate transaminase [bacterium]
MKSIDIQKLLRVDPSQASTYDLPVFPKVIKLDANESPYELPADIMRQIFQSLEQARLNRYPDPSYWELRQMAAKEWGWPAEQILPGNGSDELIQAIIVTFGGAGKTVFVPDPSFAMYRIIAKSMGENVEEIPLSDDFDLALSDLWRERMYSLSQAGHLIFLAVPNNPTGNCFSRLAVEEIIEQFPGIVCIDEAYVDFADSNYLDLLPKHPNLIILRTLSKIGLAGIRMGFLLAGPVIIQHINRVKLPYNINILSETVAKVALSQKEAIKPSIAQIKQNRDWLYEQMKNIGAVRVYPSSANFLLFKVRSLEAEKFFEQLLAEGILVRGFSSQGRLRGHFRVTVGTREECECFLNGLKKILSSA